MILNCTHSKPKSIFFLSLVVIISWLCSGFSASAGNKKVTIPLFDDLGNHHYPVATAEPLAQRYFDQGLILAFGFNHAEARRSFQEAYRIDPKCALCYWGEAWVLGPNINAPMNPAVVSLAHDLSYKALKLSGNASEKEKALMQALTKRYVKGEIEDRTLLDKAYAEAMRSVAQRFSNDSVITSLCAEALMNLHPWDFWTKQGRAQPWTPEIIALLERSLELDINNPLANHLYIHAMEASPFVEKAIPSAERLPGLVPGSGHLVHMPAHIYIRVGRYRDAILANQRAIKIDYDYLAHHHVESIYTLTYVPHNYHFLWAAAIKTGLKSLATKAAADTAAKVNLEMLREPGYSGTLQHFYLIPLYTKALFGEWDDILKVSAPANDLVYPIAIWHYARGLALLRKGMSDEAQQELSMLDKNVVDPEIATLTVFDLNPVTQLLQIAAEILRGELAAEKKDYKNAITHLIHAVELEDGLNYNEPKDWYLPPRQVLGAILLESGNAREAERVYRQDLFYHPQNGWSLFGLTQSLKAQNKDVELARIQKQFDQVWADSEVKLIRSRF